MLFINTDALGFLSCEKLTLWFGGPIYLPNILVFDDPGVRQKIREQDKWVPGNSGIGWTPKMFREVEIQ